MMTGNNDSIQHVRLTVTDVARAEAFYTTLLGFDSVMNVGLQGVLRRGNTYLTLNRLPAEEWTSRRNPDCDRFNIPLRSRGAIEHVVELFDAQGVRHGAIRDLGEFGFKQHRLTFYDPDGNPLELTAPHGVVTTRIHQVLAL